MPPAEAEDWWGKHKIWIGDGVPPTHQGSYSDFLAQSIFCLALMGDGWTARFEDGLMNGWVGAAPASLVPVVHCLPAFSRSAPSCQGCLFRPSLPTFSGAGPPCASRRCIPVIIIDNVELTWHSIMDLDAYSLRVPQADMARLPEILKAVPPENVARMQVGCRLPRCCAALAASACSRGGLRQPSSIHPKLCTA